MVRVVVDQSYATHLQTCIISCSDHYCNSQIHQSHWTNYIQMQDYILIEDDGFDRIITQVSRYTQDPCTVSQFKLVVDREIALSQMKHHVTTQIMTFLISETLVDQEPVHAPWGCIGHITCKIQLILLKTKILPKHIINECKKGLIHLVPKSLYTIEYLNHHTKLSNYALVYLQDYGIKCIVVKQGQYASIEYLNRGLQELKQLMEEMNVGQYYHKKTDEQINHLTRKLITQAIDQYTHILGQRLSHYIDRGSSIAMINQMADHPIIQEQCNHYLSQNYGFYTMECSHLLPRVSRNGDLDGQVYLSTQVTQLH